MFVCVLFYNGKMTHVETKIHQNMLYYIEMYIVCALSRAFLNPQNAQNTKVLKIFTSCESVFSISIYYISLLHSHQNSLESDKGLK